MLYSHGTNNQCVMRKASTAATIGCRAVGAAAREEGSDVGVEVEGFSNHRCTNTVKRAMPPKSKPAAAPAPSPARAADLDPVAGPGANGSAADLDPVAGPGANGSAEGFQIIYSGQPPDCSMLTSASEPGQLVFAFGDCMTKVSQSFAHIHNCVTWLRDQDIRLDTPEIMAQVKVVLKQACSANDESIDRFARVLRNLLSVEVLPAHFTVTNSISVPFHNTGDVVDGQFHVQKARLWYAGVVVGKRNPSCEKSYRVFWLGQPPKKKKTLRKSAMDVRTLIAIASCGMQPQGK